MTSTRIVSDFIIFFFQAEDGIRDIGVTGVQTCALPIFACFVLYIDSPRAILLILAGALLGLATAFRAVGVAVLPPFLIMVLAVHIGRGRQAIAALVLAALPIAVVLCAAASSQLVTNQHFTLGNWGGMDLLGKLPLLSRPAPEDSKFARLDGIVDMMEPAREQLARLGPLTQALVARQYYE